MPTPTPRVFVPHIRSDEWVTSEQILAQLNDPQFKLFDSRNADRYRGENETIDPVAGHVPGAISAPYVDNLNPDGTFKSPDQLRARFESLLGSHARQSQRLLLWFRHHRRPQHPGGASGRSW